MKENYYYDNKKYQFESEILSLTEVSPDKYTVELTGTYFYPEGGGQPGDRGSIDGFEVLDVQKIGGSVIHTISGKPDNKSVKCKIEKKRRVHYMVQHTGQHLISAVLKHELNIDTPEGEYQYEMNRYLGYVDLVPVAIEEKKPNKGQRMLFDGFVKKGDAMSGKAKQYADVF